MLHFINIYFLTLMKTLNLFCFCDKLNIFCTKLHLSGNFSLFRILCTTLATVTASHGSAATVTATAIIAEFYYKLYCNLTGFYTHARTNVQTIYGYCGRLRPV